jgi:hypothetical protein
LEVSQARGLGGMGWPGLVGWTSRPRLMLQCDMLPGPLHDKFRVSAICACESAYPLGRTGQVFGANGTNEGWVWSEAGLGELDRNNVQGWHSTNSWPAVVGNHAVWQWCAGRTARRAPGGGGRGLWVVAT